MKVEANAEEAARFITASAARAVPPTPPDLAPASALGPATATSARMLIDSDSSDSDDIGSYM